MVLTVALPQQHLHAPRRHVDLRHHLLPQQSPEVLVPERREPLGRQGSGVGAAPLVAAGDEEEGGAERVDVVQRGEAVVEVLSRPRLVVPGQERRVLGGRMSMSIRP